MSFANRAIKYFSTIHTPETLPGNINFINPYKMKNVCFVVNQFYNKFFSDNCKRIFVWGINPGRFGGGLTGISFTDPVALSEHCGISNMLGKKRELSSKFIYRVIDEYGGVKKFYSNMFLTALFPLAIIKEGKNYNYYDKKSLYEFLRPHIVTSVKRQIQFGAVKEFAVCLGKRNAKYLSEINDEYNFFDDLRVLDHPRYIMQYRLKQADDYIKKYIKNLK